jgi:hypothetical protein
MWMFLYRMVVVDALRRKRSRIPTRPPGLDSTNPGWQVLLGIVRFINDAT